MKRKKLAIHHSIVNHPLSHNTNQNPPLRTKDQKTGKHKILLMVDSFKIEKYSIIGIRQTKKNLTLIVKTKIKHNMIPLMYTVIKPIADITQDGIHYMHDDYESIFEKKEFNVNPSLQRYSAIQKLQQTVSRKEEIKSKIKPYAGK